jgi:hypothetical protein
VMGSRSAGSVPGAPGKGGGGAAGVGVGPEAGCSGGSGGVFNIGV